MDRYRNDLDFRLQIFEFRFIKLPMPAEKRKIDELLMLKNLGPKSVSWLHQVGIHTKKDLEKVGALGAYQRIAAHGFKPSLNLLYALEGALTHQLWNKLPLATRQKLDFQINFQNDIKHLKKRNRSK